MGSADRGPDPDAAGFFHDLADDRGIPPQGMRVHGLEHPARRSLADDGNALAFIRHIQRIDAEYFAGSPDLLFYRQSPFVEHDAEWCTRDYFIEH